MKQEQPKSKLYVSYRNPGRPRPRRYFMQAARQSRWYWWLPVVWIFCIPQMSRWTFDSNEYLVRAWRSNLVILLMFPTLAAITFLYAWIQSLFT